MAGPSYGFVQMQFNFFVACGGLLFVLFCIPLFRSSDFSVPSWFVFSFLQAFPFLFRSSFCPSDFPVPIRSSFPFFFPLVIFETVGFSDSKVIFSFFASSWLPPGLPFGALCMPKLAQVRPKLPFDTSLFRKLEFSKKRAPR